MSRLRKKIADTLANRLQQAEEGSRLLRLTGRLVSAAQRAARRNPSLATLADTARRAIPPPSRKRPGTGKRVVLGGGRGGAIGITHPGADSSAIPGKPGEVLFGDEPVPINVGRDVRIVTVVNTGDRPITVGSHYHFAEANPALRFDRDAAWGRRQNIVSGGMTRFDPGIPQEVELIPFAGRQVAPPFRRTEEGGADA